MVARDDNEDLTCSFGDYYHDTENKTISICISGIDRENTYENIDVSGIYCRDTCPRTGFSCDKEIGLVRKWSESTQWTENKTIYDSDTGTYKYGTGVPGASD